MPCALGYKILKSLTSFTIAFVCVCACVFMTENRARITILMLKLKHYNLFSSLTVAGFIRHTHKIYHTVCSRWVLWENAVYRFVFCFIFFPFRNPFSFLCLCFYMYKQSSFFPSPLHITWWHIVSISVFPFLAFTLMKIYFCWTHSTRACVCVFIIHVCNMRFADTLCWHCVVACFFFARAPPL